MGIIILEETLKYLHFNSMWPKAGQEMNPGRSYYVRYIKMLLSTPIIVIGSTLHLIMSLRNGSYNINEDLFMILAQISAYYFGVPFVLNQNNLVKVYVDLSSFEKFGKPQNFDELKKKLEYLSKMYKHLIDLAATSSVLWGLYCQKFCEEDNQYRDFKEACGFMVTTWMPFNVDHFPMRQILLMWQFYATLMTWKGAAVVAFGIMECLEYLVVRIQHLKYLLKRAVGTEDDISRMKRFLLCLHYHIDIFDIGSRLDEYYSQCLFIYILFTGAAFGCMAYTMMDTFAMLVVGVFVGWSLSLVMVCHSAQNLIDESESVADAAYSSEWYRRNVSFQKYIFIVIMRSQKPILMHTGPLSYLSHVILVTIFKTAYSYFTFLSTTSERN